jgi:hypothetical protein
MQEEVERGRREERMDERSTWKGRCREEGDGVTGAHPSDPTWHPTWR